MASSLLKLLPPNFEETDEEYIDKQLRVLHTLYLTINDETADIRDIRLLGNQYIGKQVEELRLTSDERIMEYASVSNSILQSLTDQYASTSCTIIETLTEHIDRTVSNVNCSTCTRAACMNVFTPPPRRPLFGEDGVLQRQNKQKT